MVGRLERSEEVEREEVEALGLGSEMEEVE